LPFGNFLSGKVRVPQLNIQPRKRIEPAVGTELFGMVEEFIGRLKLQTAIGALMRFFV
jgi:hypothetical protein